MSKNLLSYKDFFGSVSFSAEDEVFYGKIEGISDLITFEGSSVKQLKREFQESVDSYIRFCEEKGKPASKSLMGSFNIRIRPELHQLAVQKALQKNISLNQLVQAAIENELQVVNEPLPTLKKRSARKNSPP